MDIDRIAIIFFGSVGAGAAAVTGVALLNGDMKGTFLASVVTIVSAVAGLIMCYGVRHRLTDAAGSTT